MNMTTGKTRGENETKRNKKQERYCEDSYYTTFILCMDGRYNSKTSANTLLLFLYLYHYINHKTEGKKKWKGKL